MDGLDLVQRQGTAWTSVLFRTPSLCWTSGAVPVGVRDLWDRVGVLKAGISIPRPSAMLAGVCQAFFGLQLVLLDLRCGLQPVLDRVGVVEGGYLVSRTLGDAGMHWPGFLTSSRGLRP